MKGTHLAVKRLTCSASTIFKGVKKVMSTYKSYKLRERLYAIAAVSNVFSCNGKYRNINDIVRGDNIAIVGNGGNAHKNTVMINEANTVVQFNSFPMSKTTGIRPPDVHVMNGRIRRCRARIVVMIECAYEARPPLCNNNTIVCTPHIDTKRMLCIGKNSSMDASRGFMAASLLSKQNRTIILHGFKGNTHYYSPKTRVYHNIDVEHNFLQKKYVLHDR